MAFVFKQFRVEQRVNAHKVGTDSMVLGAWIKDGDFQNILDIGTGTGVLALMQAQNHPHANIIGIELNDNSCKEARSNFQNSTFSSRLTSVCSSVQDYSTSQKFDLIICNPPYFVDSTLGDNQTSNSARHTINLSISDLYKHVNRLLSTKGQFSLVFPSDILDQHMEEASKNGLFPENILIIENEQEKAIRHLISFKKIKGKFSEQKMIVKYSSGLYSYAYVELTKAFHQKVLPFHY